MQSEYDLGMVIETIPENSRLEHSVHQTFGNGINYRDVGHFRYLNSFPFLNGYLPKIDFNGNVFHF